MNKRFLWAAILLLAGSVQAAGWYRWVDKSGKVHYSDSLPADALEVRAAKAGEAPQPDNADLPYETRRAQQNFPVTLYVIEKCGDICRQASEFLNKRGIPFSEITLKTQEEFDAFSKMSGSGGVPTLAIGKVWLKNFQPEHWHSELDIAGYPKSAPYRVPAPASAVKPTQETPQPTP